MEEIILSETRIKDWRLVRKGMKFRFTTGISCFDRNDIVEVMKINLETAEGDLFCKKTKQTHKGWTFRCDLEIMRLIEEKPHEYSPVFMTGRYRTIGD